MKIKYKCVVCGSEFIANKNTRFKTCNECRGTIKSTGKNFRNRQNKIRQDINNKLKTIRVNTTNGRFNINVKHNPYVLGNSITKLCDKQLLINYLLELKNNIDKDIETLLSEN